MIGQKFGQYRVLERLGTGGMGSVYRAADELLGREVALKIIDSSMDDGTARFRAEAAALARLSHPGIAIVYELLEDDGRLVMAMEYVRGQSLQQILEQVGVLSPVRAAELCMQALAALAHAHAAGVVHRDLKPGNLMLTETGVVKIMDFGIARLEGGVHLTNVGTMLGTPAYMAPEQVLGHPVDPRADLYAMGVVFFRLVTAALPFTAETPFDMAQSQVNDAPARARDVRPDLPEWVDEILTRVLAKKPADRFQSAMEFHEAFARAMGHPQESPVVRVPEVTEVMARPDFDSPAAAPRTRARWLPAAAAVLLVGSAWALMPRGPAWPDAPAIAAPAFLESTPQPSIDPGPATVRPVAFATDATADRRMNPPKPATTADIPALPLVSFGEVKRLAVSGARTSMSDVVVQFSGAAVTLTTADGKTPPATLSYHRIAKVTYASGRDPKWDPELSGPAEKIDLPGVLGRARRWLVLQGTDFYVILRLDGGDWRAVLKTFEERARVVVDRPATAR